jgi:hypothetical protein
VRKRDKTKRKEKKIIAFLLFFLNFVFPFFFCALNSSPLRVSHNYHFFLKSYQRDRYPICIMDKKTRNKSSSSNRNKKI